MTIIEQLMQATPENPNHSHLYVSWSALTRYEECHAKQQLHMQKLKSDAADGRIFLPGTIADRSMRAYLEQDDPQMGTLADFADHYFERHTGPDAEYVIRWRGDAAKDKALVRNQVRAGLQRLEPWLHDNVLPYDYQPEATGNAFVGIEGVDGRTHRIQMHLAIDILVKPDLYSIWDLKMTTNEQYTRGKTLGQLTFYKIALAAHLGVPTTEIGEMGFVTPLLKNLDQRIVAGEDEVRVMMSRITAYAQGLWTGQFQTKKVTDWDCTRCDVQQACPKFAVQRSAGGKISLMRTASRRKGASE